MEGKFIRGGKHFIAGNMKGRPVLHHPAFLVDGSLIVADIHLGYERELWREGIYVPEQTERIAGEITELVEKTGAREVILNGDVKHTIGYMTDFERRAVEKLLDSLEEVARVTVIRGNHDGGLEEVVEVRDGVERGGYLIHHGHRLEEGDKQVMGHMHPALRLGGVPVKVWLNFGEIWVLPAFSPLITGPELFKDEKLICPVVRRLGIENFDVFLLDGSYVGKATVL